jgi:hypothetical protein
MKKNSKSTKLARLKAKIVKPLKCYLSLHDRTHLEIEVFYSAISRQRSDYAEHANKRRVETEVFIALPPQLRWDEQSYPKNIFYRDFKSHIRLKEPRLSFSQLLGDKGVFYRKSPLLFLDDISRSDLSVLSSRQRGKIETQAQIFACTFFGAMARGLRKNKKLLEEKTKKSEASPEFYEQLAKKHFKKIQDAREVLEDWRKTIVRFKAALADSKDVLWQELKYVDEYCSYAFSEKVLEALYFADSAEFSSEEIIKLRRYCRVVLRFERIYCHRHKYPWVFPNAAPSTLESLYYRRRSLRRHIWSVFFLNLESMAWFNFRRQIGPMMAAAVAAVWAAIANYWIIIYMARNSGFADISTAIVGFNGSMILLASAIAYVAKDRIKEFGRSYLSHSFISGQFDHAMEVQLPLPTGNVKLGTVKEAIYHVPWRDVPVEIKSKLDSHSTYIEMGEFPRTVLCYRRRLDLKGKKFEKHSIMGVGIQDILRFDFERLLPQLDEPVKAVKGLDRKGRLRTVLLPKVYYFDVITRASQVKTDGYQLVEHDRLTLTKDGIKRLERKERSLINSQDSSV